MSGVYFCSRYASSSSSSTPSASASTSSSSSSSAKIQKVHHVSNNIILHSTSLATNKNYQYHKGEYRNAKTNTDNTLTAYSFTRKPKSPPDHVSSTSMQKFLRLFIIFLKCRVTTISCTRILTIVVIGVGVHLKCSL